MKRALALVGCGPLIVVGPGNVVEIVDGMRETERL